MLRRRRPARVPALREATQTNIVVMVADPKAGCGKDVVSRSPVFEGLQVGGGVSSRRERDSRGRACGRVSSLRMAKIWGSGEASIEIAQGYSGSRTIRLIKPRGEWNDEGCVADRGRTITRKSELYRRPEGEKRRRIEGLAHRRVSIGRGQEAQSTSKVPKQSAG